jgi:hypothetical protein
MMRLQHDGWLPCAAGGTAAKEFDRMPFQSKIMRQGNSLQHLGGQAD